MAMLQSVNTFRRILKWERECPSPIGCSLRFTMIYRHLLSSISPWDVFDTRWQQMCTPPPATQLFHFIDWLIEWNMVSTQGDQTCANKWMRWPSHKFMLAIYRLIFTYFWQICVADFAYSHHPCLSLCVCMCVCILLRKYILPGS